MLARTSGFEVGERLGLSPMTSDAVAPTAEPVKATAPAMVIIARTRTLTI